MKNRPHRIGQNKSDISEHSLNANSKTNYVLKNKDLISRCTRLDF